MSYGYDTYNNYSQIEYAQPHLDPDFVDPNSPAAQLGLTPEEIREVTEEQERWYREEYLPELEEDKARRITEHQEQQQHQNETREVPNTPISYSKPTPQAYEVPDEPLEDTTSSCDESWLDPELAPQLLYQPRSPILIAWRPPSSPDYDTHDVADAYDEHAVACEGDRTAANHQYDEPDHDGMIKRITLGLLTSDDVNRNWAEEVENTMGLTLQDEYLPTNYL